MEGEFLEILKKRWTGRQSCSQSWPVPTGKEAQSLESSRVILVPGGDQEDGQILSAIQMGTQCAFTLGSYLCRCALWLSLGKYMKNSGLVKPKQMLEDLWRQTGGLSYLDAASQAVFPCPVL